MSHLGPRQVAASLKSTGGWSLRGRKIVRTFSFESFVPAMRFVNRVAKESERRDHHPDIGIRWNRVSLGYTTHSQDGLTAKDFQAARRVNRIYADGT